MNVPPHRLYEQAWPTGEYCFFQIAWVVDDLLASAARWVEVYGVGPFHVLPRTRMEGRYRGATASLEIQTAVTQAGPVQLELIEQRNDAPSVYRDLFPRGRSGLHHLGTITTDFDAACRHYRDLGYEAVTELESDQYRLGYFDTSVDFGVVTEVIEYSTAFAEALAGIAETCRTWQGEDPIRLLRRGGYDVPEAAAAAPGR